MRRRFTGIAALLMLLLMTPVSHACAAVPQRANTQHDCCRHKDLADACCKGSSDLGCATQAPVDTTLYPAQGVSTLATPPQAVAVVYQDRSDGLNSRCRALYLPTQHAPPGLLIAATIVLRI